MGGQREYLLARRKQVANAVGDERLRRSQIVNLDETSMRILALSLRTLHWTGAKHVAKPKRGELANLDDTAFLVDYAPGHRSTPAWKGAQHVSTAKDLSITLTTVQFVEEVD